MLRHESNSLVYYHFANLASYDEVFHGVFTRLGGVSDSPCESLNVGHLVGDDLAARLTAVEANHDLIYQALGISRSDVATAHQVHGSRAALIGPDDRGRVIPATDALITDTPGVALMLRFADCLPVLLYDPVRRAIGLAHAGWRGTVKGIAAKTASAMMEAYGSRPADIVAGLGPCIGPCCYQVGAEVIELVKARFNRWQGILRPQGDGSVHFDLWEANRRQLAELGAPPLSSPRSLGKSLKTLPAPVPGGVAVEVELQKLPRGRCSEHFPRKLPPTLGGKKRKGEIEVSQLCTACRTDEFFSHRAEGGRTGRFAVILGKRG